MCDEFTDIVNKTLMNEQLPYRNDNQLWITNYKKRKEKFQKSWILIHDGSSQSHGRVLLVRVILTCARDSAEINKNSFNRKSFSAQSSTAGKKTAVCATGIDKILFND
jgi:hypothetical protein